MDPMMALVAPIVVALGDRQPSLYCGREVGWVRGRGVVGWDVIRMSGSVLPGLARGNSRVRLGLRSVDCVGGRR